MQFILEITKDGEAHEVTTRLPDVVNYETFTGNAITSWGERTPGVRDVAVLAYYADTTAPREPFEVWLETVDAVQLLDVTTPTPTKPGRSPGQQSK